MLNNMSALVRLLLFNILRKQFNKTISNDICINNEFVLSAINYLFIELNFKLIG